MSVIFLLVSLVALALSYNSITRRRGRFGPWWLPAMLTGELAPFGAIGRIAVAVAFYVAGWAGGWAGWTGMALMAISVGHLAVIHARALRAKAVVGWAATEVVNRPVEMPRLRWMRLLRPYPSVPRGIAVARDVAYGPEPAHRLDVFRSPGAESSPLVLQVHGGGWTGGRRDQQARPLMYRMAAAGWVVFSISYRLSPRATFPDQLVDVKRAIAWIRSNAADWGADPGFIAVTGGSAGGQLAALAALTSDHAEHQPGFEDADVAVQACVPLYGVHDLLDATGTRPKWPYLSRYVLKAEPSEDPLLWDSASPIRSVRSDRPPFLVIHGTADSLVSRGESERLVAALRAVGDAPVGLAEIPGANHGFDVLHSLRTERTVDGIELVLSMLWKRHMARAGSLGG